MSSDPTLPRVAVVGTPNAGKSTLVNRLAGGREAVVDATAGVTRDRKELEAEWTGHEFVLVDTGGIDEADPDELAGLIRGQARQAVTESALALLVVDAAAGLTPGDEEVARALRELAPQVLVVANKVDGPAQRWLVAELHRLGLGEPHPVSALHGTGTGDLLDAVVERLGDRPPVEVVDDPPPRIAVIGRPNVGKSSLVNRVLGAERVIVSEQAGTTRDAIDTPIAVDGAAAVLVDTAGLRRPAKARDSVDRYAQLRTVTAAERSDVAIVVCDAAEGITAEDLRSADVAMRAGCATVVALNKWDVSATELDDARARIARKLRQRPPLVVCSAASGRGVTRLMREAMRLAELARMRIPTPELNRFLSDAKARRQPPQRRSRPLRAYYMVQVRRRPPRFQVHVNDRTLLSRDWAYFVENQLRERYALQGIPLVIDFVSRDESGRGGRDRGREAEHEPGDVSA